MIQCIILTAVTAIAGATVIAVLRWKDGDISARYFMPAWSAKNRIRTISRIN